MATWFCGSRPLSDFMEGFAMFGTFELQNLNKLMKSEVRDFSSPESFHAVYIQGFKAQGIKLSTKFRSKFPVMICPLPCNFSMLPRQSTLGTIPVVRPFLFPTQTLIQRSQRIQRLFQKLRRFYFVPSGTCQKCFQSRNQSQHFHLSLL